MENSTAQSGKTETIILKEQVLGGTEAMAFTSQLREIADKGIRCVIIDMSRVEIMNSSGLGMLVSGLSTMRKFGGMIKFASVPQKVQHLLKMTHLDTVFETYATPEEAAASFS
ncbi:MAG TPA: STAS domain-containing protein [Patescibacteria group bacterium]|nr:STAS domain-containing protein [Patescibacteria group bacterium]